MQESIEEQRRVLSAALPQCVTWQLPRGPEMHFDFARLGRPLLGLTEADVCGGVPEAWSCLRFFGVQEVEGGSTVLICIDEVEGMVRGVQAEWPEATGLYSCGVRQFIDTFRIFDELLRQGKGTPEEASHAVRCADERAYDARSAWRLLADHLASKFCR
jgi:hypothetical protein